MARDPDAARSAARHLRRSTSPESRVRAALVACTVALVACVVLSLVHDPSADAEDDTAGPTGPVEITTSAACVPVSRSGEYTSGAILLRNPGPPVEVTGIRLTGAGGLAIDQAYAVPAPDGDVLGSSAQWPPAKEQLRSAPGWLSRVRAVGSPRLGPTGGDATAGWNLVLHLTGDVGDAGDEAGYASVLVDYRVGGESATATGTDGLRVAASC